MTSFNNLDSLFKHIKNDLIDSMEDVGETVSDTTKDKIDEVVYDPYSPNEYERTYQLRDSIQNFPAEVVGEEIHVEIDHNTSLIIANPDNFQHGSNHYEPNDISSFIDVIVHEGMSGDLFGDGYWREKRQYFTATVDELIKTGEHIKSLKKSMKRKGYDIE